MPYFSRKKLSCYAALNRTVDAPRPNYLLYGETYKLLMGLRYAGNLPIGNSPHFVIYTLPSHSPLYTQTIPTVTTTKDLGIVLNTWLSAEDNVVSTANKARRMLFYLKDPSRPLPPIFSSPVQNIHPPTS